jgi:hypothetical protein
VNVDENEHTNEQYDFVLTFKPFLGEDVTAENVFN